MSFYEQNIDPTLRFGDVLKGFIQSTPQVKKPLQDISSLEDGFNLNIEVPKYSAILTPCCSIGEHKLTLCPFVIIPGSIAFVKNPIFANDLMKINLRVTAEESMPPDKWQELSIEERTAMLVKGKSYTFGHFFVYDKHDYLQSYELRGEKTSYYMIDFRTSYSIKSHLIKRPNGGPIDKALCASKLLQLSVEARSSLREKLSSYFARVPEEDLT